MSRRSWSRLEQLEAREVPAVIGALDPSLGTAGKVVTDIGADDRGTAVAIQPDGQIVVAGTADDGTADFALARYNPDGSPDLTFSNDGQLIFSLGGIDKAAAVAIQADGKIVAAGYTATGGPADFGLIRVNADGSVDTSFNGNGTKIIDFGNEDRATGLVMQPDGKIVVAGLTSRPGGGDFAVARLNADGSFDTSFNGTGKATIDFGGIDGANAVALRPDGKIVLAGFTGPAVAGGATVDFAVARLTTGGGLDTGFDGDGKATIDFGFNDVANAVALQPDGKIVLAGSAVGVSPDFAVARLNADGGLDSSFGSDGLVTYNFGATEAANGVALQPDGKVVVVGSTSVSSGGDFAVLRLTAAGQIDPAFGNFSQQTIDFGGADAAGGVALTPTGRIVVAGSTVAGGSGNFAVARLIGTVEEGRALAVGGSLNGTATILVPATSGSGYNATPAGTVGPFGSPAVNVRTATADVNGDGVQDTILVTGPGTPIRVAVVSGTDNKTVLVAPFDPFGGNFTGGGFVAAGDFDNDGRAEFVVTPDQGGGPRVTILSLQGGTAVVRANFFGIDDVNFRGGARPAVGDITGDGVVDLVVSAGFGGGPRIARYDGKSVFGARVKLGNDFFAFEQTLRNGAYVAVGDVNGDGFGDLIFGAGPGGGPRVLILGGKQLRASGPETAIANPLANFFAGGSDSSRGGVRVAAKDADGDNKADVAAGAGDGQPSRIRYYPGFTFTGTAEPADSQTLDPFGLVLPGGIFVG